MIFLIGYGFAWVGHFFFEKNKPACPVCGKIFGVLKGIQPDGRMDISKDYSKKLPGHPKCGTIVIQYNIPSGYQTVSK